MLVFQMPENQMNQNLNKTWHGLPTMTQLGQPLSQFSQQASDKKISRNPIWKNIYKSIHILHFHGKINSKKIEKYILPRSMYIYIPKEKAPCVVEINMETENPSKHRVMRVSYW